MATYYEYQCNNCSFEFSTSGPHEFYRDDDGQIKNCGHPVPSSEEARRKGVYGLRGSGYCLDCNNKVMIVLVEAQNPVNSSFAIWSGCFDVSEEDKKGRDIACPDCGSNKVVVYPDGEKPIKCPKCDKGLIYGEKSFIT